MRIKSTALFAFLTIFAAATSATPASPPAANAQALQSVTSLGSSMGAMPELQRRCGHTADNKRRMTRVIAYMQAEIGRAGGAAMADAFKAGLANGQALAAQMTSAASEAEMKQACSELNAALEPKLKAAEDNIPADFMPKEKVTPASPKSKK